MPTLTQGQIYTIAFVVGVPEPKKMAAIAMAESSGRTDVVNGIGATGLWQILQPTWVKSHPKWTKEWLKNPFNNAIAAKAVYEEQGISAWEAYTGPDGKGDDGPWQKYNKDVDDEAITPKQLGLTQKEFDESIKGQPGVIAEEEKGSGWGIIGDAAEGALDWAADATGLTAVEEAVTGAWEALTNPAFWMRLAYGVTGTILVIGGLMLLVRNSPVSRKATAMGEKIGGAVTGGKATAVKGAITKNEMAAQARTGGSK